MGPDLLHTPMPAFPVDAVLAHLAQAYGIRAGHGDRLGSERDQMLLLPESSAGPVVVKVSNHAETPETLDMENGALRHLAAVAAELPVPRLVATTDGGPVGRLVDPAGRAHLVRVLTVLPGRHVEG